MVAKLKLELIQEAQKYLLDHPQDYAHEITHHYRTWLIAKEIVDSLKEPVDKDLLEVICWWHDVEIPGFGHADDRIVKNTAEYVAHKLPDDLVDVVRNSIANHEFGSTPKYIEGQISQDADKLEILSEERLRILEEAVNAGLYDKNKFIQILKMVLHEWLPVMPERYHFEFSKSLHNGKINNVIDIANLLVRKYS